MQDNLNVVPFVSILIPVRNESAYIGKCLDSVLASDYPPERYEILVIDGASKDNTKNKVTNYQCKHKNLFLLDNARRTVSYALNLGVEKAKGEVLIWLCGHSEYCKHYIPRCVELLYEKSAASVGGRVIPKGVSMIGRAIAAALSSPIGHGYASYRSGNKPGWVDSVMGGCWLKENVKKVGGFDDRWLRNQDSKFNISLRQKIGRIYYDPSIVCYQYVRESLQELISQYYQYGYWRLKTLIKHPEYTKIRQLLIPGFLLCLVIAVVMSWSFFTGIFSLYVFVLMLFSVFNKNAKSIVEKILGPCVFISIHFAWGIGFIVSICHHLMAQVNRLI